MYTLSLHDALPIWAHHQIDSPARKVSARRLRRRAPDPAPRHVGEPAPAAARHACRQARSLRPAARRPHPAAARSAALRRSVVGLGTRGSASAARASRPRAAVARAASGAPARAHARAPHADQAVPDGLEADRRRRQHLRQREPVPRRDPSAHAREAPVARTLRPACRRPQGNLARRDPRRRLEPARLRRSRRQPGLFPAALLGVRTRGPALQAMRERDPPHRAGAALYFFLPALSALAALAFSRFSTTGSTNFDTSPPNAAISRTSVAEMNMCCSEGVRKMVSRSG